MISRNTLAAAVLTSACFQTAQAEPHVIRISEDSPGRVFEGIGAVSAGASSRLLVDYPEPQRSQILDYLFKPRFGAGFQHLKVEIGGGENSTCGSEASHALTREELANPQARGYEFWLMAEARKRNGNVQLDCLPWAFPAWVENPFSQASADWFVAFLETARQHHGLEIDWISAAQNEMGGNLPWIRDSLRPTLDARGFSKVKLQAPDDDEAFWKIFDTLETDPGLDSLIQAVGYHYVDGRKPWDIDQNGGRQATEKAKQSGKPLWASEEWSQSGKTWDGTGALYLARLINKLYARDRITKYQIWAPIDSIYPQIIWSETGAMQADSPWSGNYTVWPAIWAIAHTTQFAEPGWRYLDQACGQIDQNTWKGTHVALLDPKTKHWSAIVITGAARTIRLDLSPGLPDGPIHVWKSTANEQFVSLPSLQARGRALELALEADAIYTFTSTSGQTKGRHPAPPPATPFPLPFTTSFDKDTRGQHARYFADQKGSFEVVERPEGGSCLAQIVPAEGILWMGHRLLHPHTLFGDSQWSDVAIEADVHIRGGFAEIGGRYRDREKLGYRWTLHHDGEWQLHWQLTPLASGRLDGFDPAKWHRMRLEMSGQHVLGSIDGKVLASASHLAGATGMAVLASSYHPNHFDNVRVSPVVRAEDPGR